MGNCIIQIHVTGSHHNSKPFDIDQTMAACVDKLVADGNNVTAATLFVGGEYDLRRKENRFPIKDEGKV